MRERANTDDRLLYWGKSMYGGYYAEMLVNGEIIGLHRPTIKELEYMVFSLYGFTLTRNYRFDNI